MTTKSHANCTHEKTKAARAACRKAGGATITEAAPKAKAPERSTHYEPGEDFVRKGNISGTCGIGHHDRCMGGGKQWFCTCECHTPNAE